MGYNCVDQINNGSTGGDCVNKLAFRFRFRFRLGIVIIYKIKCSVYYIINIMMCIDKVFARLWIYMCCYKVQSKSNDNENIYNTNIMKNIRAYGVI